MGWLDREAARTAGSEMKNLADCDECRAILGDFRDSLGEVERLKDEVGTNADSVRRWLQSFGESQMPMAAILQPDGLEVVHGAEEAGADFLEALHNKPVESYFSNPRCPGFARA
ncbi:MAG TPA: hypothetical protein VEJ67_04340, partial [Candidatus Cybelea sp.]|nr:hypothetical protein [Candidatus Cybelea sp.]